ncbi:MAG: hypothetical protein K0U98_25975 [Deltaproteobacteria bacterium]|nr:hypothetical protein [Deltaproteobacteria bacterium]
MPQKPGHSDPPHTSRNTIIEKDILTLIRKEPESIYGWTQVLESSRKWTATLKPHLKTEDHQDIVQTAILETIPIIRDSRYSLNATNLALRRSLNKNRSKTDRVVTKHSPLFQNTETNVGRTSAQGSMARDHLMDLARNLKGFISLSFESLSARDQTILKNEYQFHWILIDQEVQLEFPTDGARRVALHRARERFARALGSVLEEAIGSGELDREDLQRVLDCTKGKEPLSAIRDMEEAGLLPD